ncbi:dihydropteroate synthase [Nonomuraea endophytica]|uniref:dihydropteroate synthase n=1 Tax=Nonomuraea endophytica TaxID=714136 RepID=UPI0037C874B0
MKEKFLPKINGPIRQIGPRRFDFSRQVAVMGIVNRTPNSFHDRGATFDLRAAIESVERVAEEGGDILDVGGFAFRHDQEPVSVAEELERVVPLIGEASERTDLAISVDTHRAEVAREVMRAGAHIINDTNGLRDPQMAEVIAETGAHVVIAHSLGGPGKAVMRPSYNDVVKDVGDFLRRQSILALNAGIPEDHIIIDPGHDLNKNTHHSLELTRRLTEITEIGFPTLVAVSNKDFIGETVDSPQDDRLIGTITTNTVCMWLGARIIRVHDVRSNAIAARYVESELGFRRPDKAIHNLA